jgi:hypothetical protein
VALCATDPSFLDGAGSLREALHRAILRLLQRLFSSFNVDPPRRICDVGYLREVGLSPIGVHRFPAIASIIIAGASPRRASVEALRYADSQERFASAANRKSKLAHHRKTSLVFERTAVSVE